MARKHEKFTYSYGWRTATESWEFEWNHKPIQLELTMRMRIADMILQGKITEAEAILKRLLREQEKEENYICFGFFGVDSEQFYFTQQLRCRRNDLPGKLHSYKTWKHYIQSLDCDLSMYTITKKFLMPDGKMTDGKTEEIHKRVDLKRPVIIHLLRKKENKIFQF